MLAKPLSLRNATRLGPTIGLNLSPGPAFVWWQLTLGAILTMLGLFCVATIHRLPVARFWTRIAIRLLLLALILVGLGAILRSFRTA